MDGYFSPVVVFALTLLAAVAVIDCGEGHQETRKEMNIPSPESQGTEHDVSITEILQRLDAQEARIITLEATVHRQQTQHANVVNELKTKLNKQTKQLGNRDKDIRKLKFVQRQQRKLIDDLRAKPQYNDDKYNQDGAERNNSVTKRTEESGIAQDIHEYQTETSISKNENRRLKQYTRGDLDVAFHAVLDTMTQGLGAGQKIVFDTVMLNLGSSYHQHLGAFVAPTRGVYFFSVSLLSLNKDHTQFQGGITKNGIPIASVFGDSDVGTFDQGSVSATVELDKGDEVWVRYDYPTGGGIWGHKYSSFTGYLLFPN